MQAKADRNMARLSCRFPPRGACSPWIEVPDDSVVGASPALEAKWAAVGKLVPSPTVTSRTAAVLTLTPGIDVRTGERG